MATQNLDIAVTRTAASRSYRVSADSSAHGQAEVSASVSDEVLALAGIFDRATDEFELEAAGAQLFEFLFGGSTGALFNSALGQVLSDGDSALRLRLRIDPPDLALLPWELAFDPLRSRFLAASPKILVSRSLGLLEPVRPLKVLGTLRLLAVIPEHSGFDIEEERHTLAAFGPASENRIEVECLEGSVTLEALRAALRKAEVHVIHFAGHADLKDDEATICLDGPGGTGLERVEAKAFARLLEDQGSLRLVVLNACRGAARSPAVALAGIAPQLLRHGVPAVVAMQSSVRNKTAMRFADELYATLANGRWAGQVERAISAARRTLLQQNPESADFANPVLYLRSPDGVLWRSVSEGAQPISRAVAIRPARRLPPPPSSFLGRDGELRALRRRLSADPQASERGSLVLLTGWPGVGKTTMTAALANDSALAKEFRDGALWASLDQWPDLVREISLWCIALGAPGLAQGIGVEEASLRLGELLRGRRALLIVDDVWEAAHAVPFLVGGPQCALLVTSRLDAVADQLAPSPAAIVRLPPLDEDASLELLRSRAPDVVALYGEDCRVLARALEGLPLSLHVAGRMLSEESRLWNPRELIESLREGRQLLDQKAPPDRADFKGPGMPTVSVLLARSTERLPEDLRELFSLLGSFAPKPATFDLEALRAVWDTSDPRPGVRSLVKHGLLEPLGEGRFRMHALLVAHARSLLEA